MSGELGTGLTWAEALALLISPAVLEHPEGLTREILATRGDTPMWTLQAKILVIEWRGLLWSPVGRDCKGPGWTWGRPSQPGTYIWPQLQDLINLIRVDYPPETSFS